ncbi:MAG: aminodeoxychorismate lyase [Oleiphilus sp.]
MKRPAHITHVNGVETSAIDIADRGLAYGDGLFETMRVVKGDVPLLSLHLARFLKGVDVLGLGDQTIMKQNFLYYLNTVLDEVKHNACFEASLIKIIITRGNGGRGYLPPENSLCHFIVQVFDMPVYPLSFSQEGIVLRECQYRLGYQPQLAGIKHLNRLDQVLASHELISEPEGLLLDYEMNVIEGTKSNILVFFKDEIVTPKLDLTGVQGVLRQALIEADPTLKLTITERDVAFSELLESDGVMMINSVFGSWPVHTLLCQDGKKIHYKKTKRCQYIQDWLSQTYAY